MGPAVEREFNTMINKNSEITAILCKKKYKGIIILIKIARVA